MWENIKNNVLVCSSMKKVLVLLSVSWALLSCQPAKDIIILYDNDVHCAVDGYEQMGALRSFYADSAYVAVVSAGDYVQGNVMGSISKGEYIIDIMNAVPYDYVTLGNHEFDYTVEKMEENASLLSAKTLCCNIGRLNGQEEQMLFPSYAIRRFGRTKVAFIGAATPITFNTSTPTFFLDEQGNVVYNFHKDDTFACIRQAADEARQNGADYVIVLSHLGDDTEVANSVDMIRATRGIDAVLDGHQHHVLDHVKVPNLDGDSVILTSTGTAFEYIGKLTIDRHGCLHNELVARATIQDSCPRVWEAIERNQTKQDALVSEVVGHTDFELTDHDEQGRRLVRRGDTNLADWIADAMRYVTGAEIGAIHGGSIRTNIPAGDITLGHVLAVLPFNNHMSKVEITGQELLDALELSVRLYPEENGDFHIFSGLRYTIDPSIPTSVAFDENNLFVGLGGTRRVVSAEVEINGIWTPIDPERIYTMGGLNYTLVNKGASGIFMHSRPLPCDPMKDTEAIVAYLKSMSGEVGEQYKEAQGRFITK